MFVIFHNNFGLFLGYILFHKFIISKPLFLLSEIKQIQNCFKRFNKLFNDSEYRNVKYNFSFGKFSILST